LERFIVIGLGNFGSTLARLHELGHEVLAVDSRAELIDAMGPFVARAFVGDATSLDEQDLDEPRQHELSAGALLARFFADEPHEHRESLDAAHADEPGQEGDEELCIRGMEDEVATEQAHIRLASAAAVAHLPLPRGGDLRVDELGLYRLEA